MSKKETETLAINLLENAKVRYNNAENTFGVEKVNLIEAEFYLSDICSIQFSL